MKDLEKEDSLMDKFKEDIYNSDKESTGIKKWDEKTLKAVQSKILFWSVLNIGGEEASQIILSIDKLIEEMREECLRPEELTVTFDDNNNKNIGGE